MSLRNLVYRLLRKGEAVTGTDNVYLAKGGFWLVSVQVLASASSLILAILFGRLVPKEAYGTYQYLLAWGSILSIVSLTGMSDALTQAVARGLDGTFYVVLRQRLRYSVLGFVFAAVVAGWYFWHGNVELAAGFLIIGAFFPFTASISSYNDYLTGKKIFGLQSRIYMVGSLVAATLLVLTILFLPKPLAFLGAFCLAWAATHAIALRRVLKAHPPTGGVDHEIGTYGFKLTMLDTVGNVATYFDRLVIFWLLGSRETAAYAFAIAPPEQLKGYLKNLYFMALPKIASRPIPEIRKTFFRKFWLMTGLVSVGVACYALLAPFVYRLLFPAYPEAIRLTQVYAIGLIATSTTLAGALFVGHKKMKENAGTQLSTSTMSIVLLIILVPRYGLMGAILARVITRLIGIVISVALVQRVFVESDRNAPDPLA